MKVSKSQYALDCGLCGLGALCEHHFQEIELANNTFDMFMLS